jgi:hypothetical protein
MDERHPALGLGAIMEDIGPGEEMQAASVAYDLGACREQLLSGSPAWEHDTVLTGRLGTFPQVADESTGVLAYITGLRPNPTRHARAGWCCRPVGWVPAGAQGSSQCELFIRR